MTVAPSSRKVERMTVFNKSHVDTKSQPMFFGAPLGVKGMMITSIQCLINLQLKCLDTSGDQRRFPYRRTEADYQSLRPEQKHIFTSNLKYQILLDSVQGRVLECFCTLLCIV